MSERDIPITLNGKPLLYNSVSPIFYDGAGKPHLAVQAKTGNGTKYALLLQLTANDVWIEVARDEAIWGPVSLVQRPDGTAYLCGTRRNLSLHLSADVPWVPTITPASGRWWRAWQRLRPRREAVQAPVLSPPLASSLCLHVPSSVRGCGALAGRGGCS